MTLALCGFLLRVNDVDDCAFVLDAFFGHNESLLDLGLHKGLLQANFALLDAVLKGSEKHLTLHWHKRRPQTKLLAHAKGIDPGCSTDVRVALGTNMIKVLNLLGCGLGWNVPLLRRVIRIAAHENFDQ